MLSSLKMYLAAAGMVLFGGLILWAKMLKSQRDVARRRAKVLAAGRRASRKKERIIKEEKEKTYSRTAELARDIKEKKDEKFEGVDILSNPNKRVR